MPAIRSAKDIAAKWATVTPMRGADYEAGVRTPLKNWEVQTVAAADAWEGGVSAAIAERRFEKGVKEAGFDKWQRKTIEVGVGRWPAGVRAAQSDYEEGFAPFRDVIERTTLPPRYPRGDDRNIDRVRVMARALHEAKIGR